MSEPVAFYRGDWKGDLVFRKNNTVDVRKNKSDFTKGLIKPLYADNPNQPQLTIPESVAVELDSVFAGIDATDIGYVLDQTGPYGSRAFNDYYFKNKNIIALYLAGKALGVNLVKVV